MRKAKVMTSERFMSSRKKILSQVALVLFFFFLAGNGGGPVARPENVKWPPRSYLVYYGSWDDETLSKAWDYDLVILHPGAGLANISPELVTRLRNGRNGIAGDEDDVLCIAYISIGEDEESPGGPGTPGERGPVHWDEKKGIIYGDNDYPARYVDELRYVLTGRGFMKWLPSGLPELVKGHDGIPDENGKWNSYYVYAGDSQWKAQILATMARLSGEFHVDGFFLDTLDTASPWGNYGWMQKDMASLVKSIRNAFPSMVIIANRGLFLFEKYGALMKSSIDGLLFESFVTEWDWVRGRGIQSPYLESNVDILRKTVLPWAQGPDGFSLLFLNYLAPGQRDRFAFVYDQEALLAGIPHLDAVSTPDLQKVYGPPRWYMDAPPAGSSPPSFDRFAVKGKEKGECTLLFTVSSKGRLEYQMGREVFLDVRSSEQEVPPEKIPLLKPVEIRYDAMALRSEGDTYHFSLDLCGLEGGKTRYFYARLLAPGNPFQSPLQTCSLLMPDDEYPDVLSEVSAEGREASVYLTWSAAPPGNSYRIYCGRDQGSLEHADTAAKPGYLVKSLENGKAYCFTVTAVSGRGLEGGMAPLAWAMPVKCTPPPSPTGLVLEPKGTTLTVSWRESSSPDVVSCGVYCFRSKKGLRLPVIVEKGKSSIQFEKLLAGEEYTVFVTALDGSNNQGAPKEVKRVMIPRH
ncbi:MAG: hypothetical protein RDV48_17665 [Candidatus Eremiobacteraeota bacterium]|nr:hypothetical protein [Candidatus Eremiobacteraeota bacterium]